VHATLADWGKFARLHLQGAVGDVQIGKLTLHQATFARLHRSPYTDPAFGLGWVRETRDWAGGDGTMLWHNGSNTMWYCLVRLAPARGFATLVTTNRFGPGPREAVEKASDLLVAEFERLAAAAPKR
jgi:CubicO group peptidase (beta-lactamase class C family)